MSYALGQPVTLSALVRNDAGTLSNAGSVALTITKPDGTTDTPTVPNPPSVAGTYVYPYIPAASGLFTVRWVFGGANASAPVLDSFYVEPSDVPPLISLAEARRQCRLASPDDDPEVQWHALVASDICEHRTQVWRRTTITQTLSGSAGSGAAREFLKLRGPVLSVTSVTENGVSVPASGWVLDGRLGYLYRGSATMTRLWSAGRQNVAVTYVAGAPDAIPAGIRQGVRLLVQHLWDAQRGGSGLPGNEGADFELDVRTGFLIPYAVLEAWRPYIQPLSG